MSLSPEPPNQALPSGYTFSKFPYQLIEVLGQGGFGITYKATELKTNLKVVIKEHFPLNLVTRQDNRVIPLQVAGPADFKQSLGHFLKEAQTLTNFNHANIVKIKNYFRDLGTAYFVMPFLAGESLETILSRSPGQSLEEIKKWFTPILDGLQAVHARGIVHRDIKPSNVFIQTDLNPILIDFGSAGDILGGDMQNQFVTHGFAPPEQYLQTAIAQGPWTDIYALGAVLLYCLTGRDLPNSVARLIATTEGTFDPLEPTLQAVETKLKPIWARALRGCLCPEVKGRIKGVAELRRYLGIEIAEQPSKIKPKSLKTEAINKQNVINPKDLSLKGRLKNIWTTIISYYNDIRMFLFKDKSSIIFFIVFIIVISLIFYIC
ncbi:MAG: serine/threonine protein kinase [Deltaproteobacteria bacterium]|jgi:serine/threonine protein kinase|nr:serine/threonine protein kinase [Deltaproteobacteria bacterium]